MRSHALRFRKLAEERLAGHFRVVSLDLRGHGHSGWEPPWSIETHVDDVLETAAELGVERARWIGHSFGGRLVMEIAARRPEAVERAVLLDPAIRLSPKSALEAAEAERADLPFASPEAAIEHRLASGTVLHTPRELLEEEMEQHLALSPDSFLRYRFCQSAVIAAWGEMCRPAPPAARVPTLLVVAAEYTIVQPSQAESYHDAVGDLLETVTVPGAHLVLWDAFTETADAIERFLA